MKYLTSWLLQQGVSALAPLVWAVTIERILDRLLSYWQDTFLHFVWLLLLVLFAPFLGYLVGRLFPGAVRTGKWVWVLPFLTFILLFADDLIQFPPGRAFNEFFTIRPPGGLTTVFITYPAWCCCCYSAAIRLSARPKTP